MTLRRKRESLFGSVAVLCFAGGALLISAATRPDQPPPGDAVGAIVGEAIAVTGPMSVEVAKGQVRTVLRSGADVRVKAGSARIDLVEGGQISICGPAHFSVLKSGGALTVALDSGTIHAHIEHGLPFTVYTPQIQAKPVAIGAGAQDTLIGFDAAGTMCVRANTGAVRLEQQLTAQTIIVPQSADVLLTNGQFETMRSGGNYCACELQPAPSDVEVSKLATDEDLRAKAAEVRPRPVPKPQQPIAEPDPPKEEPVYQVFMPPLTYDASKKVQSEFDPNLIVLVRRVRVRPTLIFQGRVEGDPIVAENAPAPRESAASPPPATAPTTARPAVPNRDDSFLGRAKALWKRIWPRRS